MILTLHVPGTTVKRVQEALKVYIPPMKSETIQHPKKAKGSGRLEIEATSNDIQDRVSEKEDGDIEPEPGAEVNDNASSDDDGSGPEVQGESIHQKPLVFQVAINQLSSVIVSGNVSITIPVLQHLAKSAVPVIFTEKNKPIALLNPFAAHGSVRVRKEQFAAIDNERGFYIASKIVHAALENKARMLLGLAKNRASTNPDIEKSLRESAQAIRDGEKKLDVLRFSPDPVANRFKFMGIEGDGSKEYFGALERIIPTAFNFSGRNRRPPKDPVNAMLSLGYTIIQGYINIGIAAVGLEPFAGFLHADRSGKPSLVLDMMEEFRQPAVDRLVITLVTKNIIKPAHFVSTSTGVQLTEAGRNIFVTRLIKRVAPLRPDEEEKSTDRNYYKNIIKQARDLSRFLLGLSGEYVPHVMDW